MMSYGIIHIRVILALSNSSLCLSCNCEAVGSKVMLHRIIILLTTYGRKLQNKHIIDSAFGGRCELPAEVLFTV